MITTTDNSYFPKTFFSLIDAEKIVNEIFQPAILFLADHAGNIQIVRESSILPQNLLAVFKHITGKMHEGTRTYEDECFIVATKNVQLKNSSLHWDGYIGIVTEKSKYDRSVLDAFFNGLHPIIQYASRFIEERNKKEREPHEKTIDDKVAELLKDTNFTNDIHVFAKSLLMHLQRYFTIPVDILFFIKNDSRQIFLPIESTNVELMKKKEKYTIYLSRLEKYFTTIKHESFSSLRKINVQETLFADQYKYDDFVIFPIFSDDEYIGLIMYLSEAGECHLSRFQDMQELLSIVSPWINRMIVDEKMALEKTRKELLLKVTQKFHSSMDVNDILEAVIEALYDAYPSFEVDLFLSLDWDVSEHLPIRQLHFTNDDCDNLAAKAYLTGELQAHDFLSERRTILYVPLKGKQGIYGVFKMKAPNTLFFEDGEIKFIQVLADTAGSAIENAELYQQSQQQIANLQLINETTQQLNKKFKLYDVIHFMVNNVKGNFAIDELGFILFESEWTDDEIIDGSSPYFRTEQAKEDLKPLIMKMKEKKEGIFLGNCKESSLFRSSTYLSLMAVPMIHNQKVIGAVIGLGKKQYAFSFDTYKLFRSIVQHSTLVFVNSMLHEELEQLVITDYLTKLYNRKYLDEQVTESLEKDQFGSFILIDIDEFKQINDKYGHQKGDEVIIQVANIIKEQVKGKNAIAARWGGEEMAVYLREMRFNEAIQIAEQIRWNVEKNCDFHVTVSCGVSYWSSETGNRSLSKLFQIADKAMYKAKKQGRNKVVY